MILAAFRAGLCIPKWTDPFGLCLIAVGSSGVCPSFAEYTGLDNPLRLRDCDADNRKQRWYLNEQ